MTLPQRTLLSIGTLLAGLMCITFGYDVWQWHSDWTLAHQTSIVEDYAHADETASLIAAIPKEHLFGKSFADGDMPISNLQLLVTGIDAVENGQDDMTSKAYISMAGKQSKIYQTGDDLANGVKVYAITPEAVILENDGHFEKLPLPREPLQFKPPVTVSEEDLP